MRKKVLLTACTFSLFLLCFGLFVIGNHSVIYTFESFIGVPVFGIHPYLQQLKMMDVSRLQTQKVSRIVKVNQLSDIQNAIRDAKMHHLKISMAGAKHSQGGQTFYPKAIVLDMKQYNKILSLDTKQKIIRVQTGAKWKDVQDRLNKHHLAVQVMQSSNIFTIGGSLSANVHGRDPRHGSLIETVESFRLLTADGKILNVSRTENSELFPLAIGGFGLFGVILDVDLRVTDNVNYKVITTPVDYHEFTNYFENSVLTQPIELVIGRMSIDPNSDQFLKEMYLTTYKKTKQSPPEDISTLQNEEHVDRNKYLFNLARRHDWGKSLSWSIQKEYSPNELLISRNNAMRPEVRFLDYYSPDDTDILQEYFVPTNQFPAFIDALRKIVLKNHVNLLNVTVRYIRKSPDAHLSYARHDGFAIVLLINQKLSDEGRNQTKLVTQQLIDATIGHQGTYYLIYQLYPTGEQLRKVYPNIDTFFEKKRKYDKDELFMNMFYQKYAKEK